MRFRIDIEVQHQKQQLLEAVGQLGFARWLEFVATQAVDVLVERGKVGPVLASFERQNGHRQRVGARRLETIEHPEPFVEPPLGKQRFGKHLVRLNMVRIARKHVRECLDRSVGAALTAKDDADIEVGSMELRVERQCALVRAQCADATVMHLQRNTIVVMGGRVVRLELHGAVERRARGRTVALRQPRQPERAPKSDLVGRKPETFLAQRDGFAREPLLAVEVGERHARLDIRMGGGKRRSKRHSRFG